MGPGRVKFSNTGPLTFVFLSLSYHFLDCSASNSLLEFLARKSLSNFHWKLLESSLILTFHDLHLLKESTASLLSWRIRVRLDNPFLWYSSEDCPAVALTKYYKYTRSILWNYKMETDLPVSWGGGPKYHSFCYSRAKFGEKFGNDIWYVAIIIAYLITSLNSNI